jgi:hypothetical protein
MCTLNRPIHNLFYGHRYILAVHGDITLTSPGPITLMTPVVGWPIPLVMERPCEDHLCGLVVRVPGYRSSSPGSIPRATRFWEVVGLELGPFNLVSTTEELFERKSSDSGLENREYGCRDQSRLPRGTLPPQKLALTWPTRGCRSVGIVCLRTTTTEFSLATMW